MYVNYHYKCFEENPPLDSWHWCVLISVLLQYFEWLLLLVYDEIQITWNTLNAGSGHNFEGVFTVWGPNFWKNTFFKVYRFKRQRILYIFGKKIIFFANTWIVWAKFYFLTHILGMERNDLWILKLQKGIPHKILLRVHLKNPKN